jgi:predicted GNAT family acetyltransferase
LIDKKEIVATLSPLNGLYFNIASITEYAEKITRYGNCLELRLGDARRLISYVLFYDNQPQIFISMVWTHPDHRGRGYAKKLLKELIRKSSKDLLLEVDEENPACKLYRSLGFLTTSRLGKRHSMRYRKRVAIMQPYVFPYIGYFNLIDSSDLFVFYDDVNFITRGWINRNKILANGEASLFSIPVLKGSQNKAINEISVVPDQKWRKKLERKIQFAYSKAPYYKNFAPELFALIYSDIDNISELAIASIVAVYKYLDCKFEYTRSSECCSETKYLSKSDRLIQITKDLGYGVYVNAEGGRELYSKSTFLDQGIELQFISGNFEKYQQFGAAFITNLSIIDALMFNDRKAVKHLIQSYQCC